MFTVSKPKVALVQDWLISLGGAEKVLLNLHELFPDAPIYTSIYRPEAVPEFDHVDVKTSFLQKMPLAQKRHRLYLPLMPLAFESLDLRAYDIVISSSHACAKGIITRPDTLHVSYVHTPIRYAWDMFHTYMEAQQASPLKQALYQVFLHYIRLWDVQSSLRVDSFIANSEFIKRRIQKVYRRDAEVIYPPVEVPNLSPDALNPREDFYLLVSRLVPYKRVDLAIEAFKNTGRSLKVVGAGPDLERLKAQAPSNIQFLGAVDQSELKALYLSAQALVFPGIEDFGIVPVEAQAHGCPVIAYAEGGACETVIDGKTGVLYRSSLQEALAHFEGLALNERDLIAHAQQFQPTRFQQQMNDHVEGTWAQWQTQLSL